MHVTLGMRPHVWQLRSRPCFEILERAYVRGAYGAYTCRRL